MNPKRTVTALLLLFVAGSVGYVFLGSPGGRDSASENGQATGSASPELIVYYMDMGKDCSTCLNLETYTHDALEEGFAPELASGAIQWRTVDLDLPENEHYIQEYGLYTKSVVLVRMESGKPGRFDSLSRIWELVYDRDAYVAYIQAAVRAFLAADGAPAE